MPASIWRSFTLLILFLHPWAIAGGSPPVFSRLPNGLEIVLLEDHANPVIASYFVVKIGLRGEDASSCGISHLLEHLLFNGTGRRTQKQLYEEADLLGAYNNAFTRDDYTCYLMVAPRENFSGVLDLQQDMLFHSTIPADKLEKERGIVLEELAKDRNSPDYPVETAMREQVYAGTPYALPVVGTPESIGGMSRELIWKYYQAFYVPNNMTLLLVGDFQAGTMLPLLTRLLGEVPSRPLPASDPLPDLFTRDAPLVVAAEVPAARLVVATPAPTLPDPDRPAFEVAQRWLEDENRSPLAALAGTGGWKSFEGSLQENRDYAIYQISWEAETRDAVTPAAAAAMVTRMRAAVTGAPDESVLASYKLKLEVEEIYNQENIHYLGMMKGQILAGVPYPEYPRFFGETYLERLRRVTAGDVLKQARRILDWASPLLVILNPAGPEAPAPMKKMPARMGGHE